MKRRVFCLTVLAIALFAFIADNRPAAGCTGIRLRPADGSTIVGRTMEFAADLQSNVVVLPRGMQYVGTAPSDQPGLRWKSRYAGVGANAFGVPAIIDGLNEKGLAVALYYFPGYAGYQAVDVAERGRTIAPWELPTYLLGTCADADEAVAAAHNVRVADVPQKDLGYTPPCHYIVHDAAGRCRVIEYVDGQLRVHDNPLGVITNAPTFDWHVTNLRNYVNLTVDNVPPVELAGIKLNGFGQGSGMLGLPGDFTPPSRFIRAVAFSQSALPSATAADGVLQAFHLLNQFDIPKGAARGEVDGKPIADYTFWTSVADLTNRRYCFRTFENSRIRMIDLRAMDLNAETVKTVSMAGQESIEDLSGAAK